LSQHFVKTLLIMIGIAVAAYLVIAVLVYAGGGRRAKRYRPGRPFAFRPVWFLSAPERQSGAKMSPGRELTAATGGAGRVARPRETGGASDRW